MESSRDWIALSLAEGVGPARFWQLLREFGTPGRVLQAPPEELSRCSGRATEHGQQWWRNRAALYDQADSQLERLGQATAQAVTYSDERYPDLLRQIHNPPPVLYLRGDVSLFTAPAVAIIGSRAATSYGRRTAFALARDLAAANLVIVSGLALGVDAQAHAGCLAAGGKTIGVLGCGLDVVYPRSNRELFRQIAEQGLLVSEYPLGTKPEGFRFPARNRIIAGLSGGVVVVEASRKSGSLITVQYALDEGREVFAVPGQIDSVKSAGTHWLLQQGASLIISAEDVCAGLGVKPEQAAEITAGGSYEGLDQAAVELLGLIEPYPMQREHLLALSKMSAGRFNELLLMLELDGYIEALPGDEVRRVALD